MSPDAQAPVPQDPTVPPKPRIRQVSRLAPIAAAVLLALLFLLSGLFLPRRDNRATSAPPAAPALDPQRRIEELLGAAQRDRQIQERKLRENWEARRALDSELAGEVPFFPQDDPAMTAEEAGDYAQARNASSASPYPIRDVEPPAPREDPRALRLREAKDSPVLATRQEHRSGTKPADSSSPFPSVPPPPADLLAQLLGTSSTPVSPPPQNEAPAPEPARLRGARLEPMRPASPFALQAGAIIPATLMVPVNSDLPGAVTALVNQNVYDSLTGRNLLIPRGSRLFGQYDSNIGYGQDRLVLTWTRLTLPDGTRYELDLPSADAAGAAGVPGKVDRHLVRMYGSALLLSVLSAGAQLSQPDSYGGFNQAPTAAEVGAGALGQRINDVSTSILQRELRVNPTITLRPGALFNVLATADIVFPAR